ncbi:MAG: hypothetical protein AB9869_23545 [Verrucomicrobiia bacterium]
MKFAFLSGLTIWVGFLALSQHGLAKQSTLTSADRELTIQGSLLCNGVCLPDPKPDDHLMVLYAIDGTPDIRAPVARLADDFYPDKGLNADSAAKLMEEFTARLKCYISPQIPGLPKPKSTPDSHYCQPATSCAVTGRVFAKDGRKQIGEPTRGRSHAQAPTAG